MISTFCEVRENGESGKKRQFFGLWWRGCFPI
nr:MAG TPA: hypothetical protein [Caudoviricetes sp.]